MSPVVRAQVEGENGGRGHGSGRRFAHNGDHAAVMIGVEVDIEELGARIARDQLDEVRSAAFADIDDALEHDEAVTRGEVRPAGCRNG